MAKDALNIVVVGGGAGGLELVTRLGNKLGRRQRAHITLVDKSPSHLWKPLLHEVATGVLDPGVDAISYRAHATNHHFHFQLGSLQALDREQRQITLGAIEDEEGDTLMPERQIPYDILVLAIGSRCNDFGTPGVAEHCIFLDTPEDAENFRRELNNACLKLNAAQGHGQVDVIIVGGGATGVELSAELHHAVQELHHYGLEAMDNSKLKISLLEAGPRILSALPERVAASARQELSNLGVAVRCDVRVTEADAAGVHTADGHFIAGQLKVWAAGVKAPGVLRQIGGLQTNRQDQIEVNRQLQCQEDEAIFVIGDCASLTQEDGSKIPPRAQAAHQMATCCYKNILARIEGKPLRDFIYKDHGSLVSLSRFSTVGSLMGNLVKGSMMIEGRIARVVYISLYRMHQVALHGWLRTALIMLVGRINRLLRPSLKLH